MRRLKESKYFHLGAMLLGVVTVSIVLLAIVLNLEDFRAMLRTVWGVFSPVVLGVVFAYLLNPLMNFVDRRLRPFLEKKKMKPDRAFRLSRAVSLVFALLCAGILVYEFCAMLLPQLYDSVMGIVGNLANYYTSIETWVLGFLANNPDLQAKVDVLLENSYVNLQDWITNVLPNWINSGSLTQLFNSVTSSVMNVVGAALDLLIGLCAAVYMLWSRDLFLAQGKKIVVALCKQTTADRVFDLCRRINKVFSGFITGKIVDSLIIGVLCYIGMLILKLPYPALIATVVGVTNVIPFFGPFIGAIPSAFLILLVNPLQAVYFSIFILALQQLDGNVIGPHILGDTIGISGFWVLVSITVAGGLFGFAGMVLGVPVFAVLYMLITDFVHSKLRSKGLSDETLQYHSIQKVEDLAASEGEAAEDAPGDPVRMPPA